jgi:hypothetical protein
MALEGVNVVADLDAIPADPIVPATVRFLYDLRSHLPHFAVYDHPTDFPDHYVARMWLTRPSTAVHYVLKTKDLMRLRDTLEAFGLVHLDRMEADDPVILETWI